MSPAPALARHRVLVIGSGFGGLWATRRLADAPVEVTVVDRTTTHLFQPLLYQVATGILSEGEISPPFRDIVRKQRNARVVLGDVHDVDLEAKVVRATSLDDAELELPYDTLIVAAGARTSYFGNDHFADDAPGLKSVADALELRARIFGAFEVAEVEPDEAKRRAWMTFVVVGGGPTGVEMAGQIAELARRTLDANFRQIDPSDARIVLVDAAPGVLGGFGGSLPRRAQRVLEAAGVEMIFNAPVTGVDETGIELGGDHPHRIEARTKVWGAGVEGVPLGRRIAEQAGVQVNRKGQVPVEPDCTLPGHPEVFVVGDLMELDHLPGVAEVAMQSGRHAAQEVARRLEGDVRPRKFKYVDLGTLASIARYQAVGELGPIRFWGFLGWLFWLVVHLTFLTGFKNRITTLFHWIVTFVGNDRSERTFSTDAVLGRGGAGGAGGKQGSPPVDG